MKIAEVWTLWTSMKMHIAVNVLTKDRALIHYFHTQSSVSPSDSSIAHIPPLPTASITPAVSSFELKKLSGG